MSFEEVSYKPLRTTKMISDGVEIDIPRAWVYYTWEDLKWGREKELAQTDWWVMPDRTTTDAQRAYRQFLGTCLTIIQTSKTLKMLGQITT